MKYGANIIAFIPRHELLMNIPCDIYKVLFSEFLSLSMLTQVKDMNKFINILRTHALPVVRVTNSPTSVNLEKYRFKYVSLCFSTYLG